MSGIEFAEIAARLDCATFAAREMRVSHGRAQCPFHGGERFNLQFFPRDGRCYCHVCHRTADVVQLAAAVWHTNQLDAARILNEEFSLGVDAGTPTDEQRQRRQRDREQHEADERAAREAWARACSEEQAAQRAIERFSVEDAEKPEFTRALTRLCEAQQLCDVLWADVTGG